LLNSESSRYINIGKSTLDLRFNLGQYCTVNKKMPEAAVAYDEQFVRGLYEKYGFEISDPIHYGSWCGREKFLSYQDIILAKNSL